jgi:DNA-binding response OmpR family regulator
MRLTSSPRVAGKGFHMSVPVPLRILLLEDNSLDAELMLVELRRAGFETLAVIADTKESFANLLSPDLDLILCDHALPQFSSKFALEMVRERALDVPFIIVSGTISELNAVNAMKNGADDYLIKDRIERLGQAAVRAIERRRMRGEIRKAEGAFREIDERFERLSEKLKKLV